MKRYEYFIKRHLILVVDDSAFNRFVAQKILNEKYDILLAEDGKQAIEILSRQEPDLILLDFVLPGMDGFEVLNHIRLMGCQAPVVFLTSDEGEKTEIRGLNAGASDFIRKPFVAEVMLKRIQHILDLYVLQKRLQFLVEEKTRELEEHVKKLHLLTLSSMLTLVNTIDAKDHYTKGHSIRVAEYSREIARRCGKTPSEQEDIYFTGLLHDIGKIGIPDEIISKTSKLSDEEFAIIKSHPAIGGDILKEMAKTIPVIADGAMCHHERYDGKGYPRGLKGKDIPEIARIISVADSYDAMASTRSYRKALPQEVVRERIAEGRGTQFDPKFADIMLEMIDEDKEYKLTNANE